MTDEREKPSWRERDAKNNRSPHALKEDRKAKPNSRQKREESLAKKNLEDLFTPKTSKDEISSWKAVCLLKGSEYSAAAKAHIEKFGYPKDWQDLLSLLDAQDAALVTETLLFVRSQLEHQTQSKRELFLAKLKVLAASCDDYNLSKLVASMLSP